MPFLPCSVVLVLPSFSPTRKWQNDYPLFIWYTIAGVAGFYIILNVLQTTHRFFRRRAAVARRQQAEKASSEAEDVQGGSVPLAGVTLFRKTFIWREFSVGLWKQTPGELFFSVGYLLMVLMFGLMHRMYSSNLGRLAEFSLTLTLILLSSSQRPFERPNARRGESLRTPRLVRLSPSWCARGTYSPAFGLSHTSSPYSCQLPFLVGLAGKNNVISCECSLLSHGCPVQLVPDPNSALIALDLGLTGISYEKVSSSRWSDIDCSLTVLSIAAQLSPPFSRALLPHSLLGARPWPWHGHPVRHPPSLRRGIRFEN